MMGGPMMSGAPGMMMGGPSGIAAPRPSGPASMYYPPGHPMAPARFGTPGHPEQIEREVRRSHGPPTHDSPSSSTCRLS
jgi:hypothetical protein